MTNQLKKKLIDGKAVIGSMVYIPSPKHALKFMTNGSRQFIEDVRS